LRAVTASTAAVILQVNRKAFDNMLMRIGSNALQRGRQGVERRIPISLIEDLLLARELSVSLAVPIKHAFFLARKLLGRTSDGAAHDFQAEFVGSLPVGHFVQLGADVARLRDELQLRLETAVESVVRRPRGRPASRKRSRPLVEDST